MMHDAFNKNGYSHTPFHSHDITCFIVLLISLFTSICPPNSMGLFTGYMFSEPQTYICNIPNGISKSIGTT